MKNIIQYLLEKYAIKLIAKYQPKIIVVTGSVGKTSTRNAITTILQKQYRVLLYEGNFNVEVSVPVVLFGLQYPKNVRNPFAWFRIFRQMQNILKNGYDYDVAVLELGLDAPGDIDVFARYLHPDITVVSAISPEHMQNFGSMDVLAREEVKMTGVSKLAVINRDDVAKEYDQYNMAPKTITYGFDRNADFQFKIDHFSLHYGYDGRFSGEGLGELKTQIRVVGAHNIKPVIAGVAVAAQLQVTPEKIAEAVADIAPVEGRMNLLHGAERSIILDDSYNSSPLAAKAALQTLYDFDAPARFAILGSMNELGAISAEAHKEVGDMCDPSKLEYVVTIGDEAKKYLAPAAKQSGCHVESFDSPYDAGAFVRAKLSRGAVVLVKGSQNGVFSEEAAKLLLEHPEDEKYLVRQSPHWMQIKHEQFNSLL